MNQIGELGRDVLLQETASPAQTRDLLASRLTLTVQLLDPAPQRGVGAVKLRLLDPRGVQIGAGSGGGFFAAGSAKVSREFHALARVVLGGLGELQPGVQRADQLVLIARRQLRLGPQLLQFVDPAPVRVNLLRRLILPMHRPRALACRTPTEGCPRSLVACAQTPPAARGCGRASTRLRPNLGAAAVSSPGAVESLVDLFVGLGRRRGRVRPGAVRRIAR